MIGNEEFFKDYSRISPVNIDEYLARIGSAQYTPSTEYLKFLHKKHLLNIPFENLDIHYNRKIILDIQKIFSKIIHENRGGFCFELNGLFFHLLANLGYKVSFGAASVFENDQYGDSFDHMVVFVKSNGNNYLCDVGFGDAFIEPKLLVPNLVQLDYNKYFKFDLDPDDQWILKVSNDASNYKPLYRFAPKAHDFIEFLPRCNYHQESPNSIFTQKKIITQLIPEGRFTLSNREFKSLINGEIIIKEILNEDDFLHHLEEVFGINYHKLINQQFD